MYLFYNIITLLKVLLSKQTMVMDQTKEKKNETGNLEHVDTSYLTARSNPWLATDVVCGGQGGN